MQNFQSLGAPPPDPRASGGWGLCPQTPSLQRLGASPPDLQTQPPLLRISGYAPANSIKIQKLASASWLSPHPSIYVLLINFDIHIQKLQSVCKFFYSNSSVARGRAAGAVRPPIALKSIQNTTFLVLVRPIFAPKMKIAPQWYWRAEAVKNLLWLE